MCVPVRNHLLAEREGLGGVRLCGCGTLHLAVGGVTLRMAPEAFHAMLTMCQDAANQLLMEGGYPPEQAEAKTVVQ